MSTPKCGAPSKESQRPRPKIPLRQDRLCYDNNKSRAILQIHQLNLNKTTTFRCEIVTTRQDECAASQDTHVRVIGNATLESMLI